MGTGPQTSEGAHLGGPPHRGGLTVVDLESSRNYPELSRQLSWAGGARGPRLLISGRGGVPLFQAQREAWARKSEPAEMALVIGDKVGGARSWREAACTQAAALVGLGLVPDDRRRLVIASRRELKAADVAVLKRNGAAVIWSWRESDGAAVPFSDLAPAWSGAAPLGAGPLRARDARRLRRGHRLLLDGGGTVRRGGLYRRRHWTNGGARWAPKRPPRVTVGL